MMSNQKVGEKNHLSQWWLLSFNLIITSTDLQEQVCTPCTHHMQIVRLIFCFYNRKFFKQLDPAIRSNTMQVFNRTHLLPLLYNIQTSTLQKIDGPVFFNNFKRSSPPKLETFPMQKIIWVNEHLLVLRKFHLEGEENSTFYCTYISNLLFLMRSNSRFTLFCEY